MARIDRAGALTRAGLVSVLSLALLGLTAPASGATPTTTTRATSVALPAAAGTTSSSAPTRPCTSAAGWTSASRARLPGAASRWS